MVLTSRFRLFLVLLGVALIIVGLSAIIFAVIPLPDASVRDILPATVMAPP